MRLKGSPASHRLWASAFWNAVSTGGLPNLTPAAIARRLPSPVRSRISSRSNSAMAASMVTSKRPLARATNSAPGAENGRPIAKSTLFRHFKNELASGRSMLKDRVAGKFYAALDNNEPWAIQMANQFGWDRGRGGFNLDAAALTDDRPETTVHVEFIVPGRREERPAPLPGPALGYGLLTLLW
jgi:hypothetical protein